MMWSKTLTLGAAALALTTSVLGAAIGPDSKDATAGKIIEAVPRTSTNPNDAVCPDLDYEVVPTKQGTNIRYYCDVGYALSGATDSYTKLGQTVEGCVSACEEEPKCQLAMLSPAGVCTISFSFPDKLTPMDGFATFFRGSPTDSSGTVTPSTPAAPSNGVEPPCNGTNATATSALEKRQCQNDGCWDNQVVCTYSGVFSPDKDLEDMVNWFCAQELGYSVNHQTWMEKTGKSKAHGLNMYAGVHDTADSGSWYMGSLVCSTGFDGLLKGCQGNGGSQGGYIWYFHKKLTFVLGVEGNQPPQPDGYCEGYC